ncbi:MAG: hypothetical protein ACHQ53_10480 [Polyangiales bacterium]
MAAAPDDQRSSEGPPLPRWALWLMLPGIIAPLVIFGFIIVTQRAHDEARCPYRELERRQLSTDASVVEETRSCVQGVQERRYSLLRGTERRVLGERRFDAQAFAAGHYRWSAAQTAQGEVQVVVHNDGHEDVLFREGTAEERQKGISKRHVRAGEVGAAASSAP